MRSQTLPTTDLYFLNSCGRWVNRWWRSGPIRRLGANSFVAGDTFLLIRRDTPRLMEQALGWQGRLVYLLDDDIEGAADTPSLPADYRERMTDFATLWLDRLLRQADLLVVSCETLKALYGAGTRVSAPVVRLDPYWNLPFADVRHHEGLPSKRLEIVHLGTASHAGALAAITPALVDALDRSSRARLTFFGVRGAHPALDGHARARRLEPMRWSRYRRWLPRQRFHLALYPLEDTPFDRARSLNKIIEHAIVGAVGVYPAGWEASAALGDAAIAAPDDPRCWHDCLMSFMGHVESTAHRARRARADLIPLADPAKQQRFWLQNLGLE